jgi:hypothetical protein
MLFTDALELGKPRRTKEGYLAVRARSARTGVYKYDGHQVDPENKHGLRDQGTVNVLRDEATVFDERAVRTFVGKPITVDHPNQAVTAANWKDHSRGAIMGALRDGDYLAFDLLLMDAGAIKAVEDGKKELSNGYAAALEFGDFTAPDGTKCQVRQSRIEDGNHVALVDAGRAGPNCRISDGGNLLFETCDAATIIFDSPITLESPKMPHTLTIDGFQVPDVSDAAKAAIEKLQGQAKDALAAKDAADAQVATLTTEKAALDAKVVTLEKQVSDAKLSPQQLRDAAKAYQGVVDKAKALGVAVTDEMDEGAVMKATVTAKLGDAAKDWTDVQIAASFATLTKDAKATSDNIVPITTPKTFGDGADVRNLARLAQYN